MFDHIYLNIANVHISIRSSQIPLLQRQERAYLPFEVRNGKEKIDVDIDVDLVLGSPPDTSGWTKIFEDEESWSVYRYGDEYLIQFAPKMHGVDPLWVAHLDQNSNRVVVYCNERLTLHVNGRTGLLNPVRYPLDQCLMMYHLSKVEGALTHAAGWRLEGQGFIFPGKSGAGKSTISRLLSSKRNWQGLSDDRVVVRQMAQGIECFGTPWPGEGGHAINSGVSLSGIFFLRHGNVNRIKELTAAEAMERLMPVVSIPWYDRGTCLSIIQFCEDVLSRIPAYELDFKPTLEIVAHLEGFIHSQMSVGLQGAAT
jgi:hypothetical protein